MTKETDRPKEKYKPWEKNIINHIKYQNRAFNSKKEILKEKEKPLYKLFPSYTVWHVTCTL